MNNVSAMEGNMPRKNVESFAGNAQYGDRNKGLVDWKMVFAAERERYAVQTALKGTPTQRKRPHADEVEVDELESAAKEWKEQAGARKKAKEDAKIKAEEDAAAAAAAASEAPPAEN
eukprot:TRINITY_DN11065_c0_g1_i10.p1 TRINITY_DN11065_c0_g1~~TRINITY_DN11065_c0_g1_i10.p1  ORF type:complete len:117 (+),score=35.98 TRINITY_DN11065_c0_g1_i10:117-467(+)